MQIQIQTTPLKISDSLLDSTTKKLEKLKVFFERIEKCDVILKKEKNDQKKNFVAEVHITIPKEDLFASERAENFEKAVDHVIEDLRKQLIKHKEKLSQTGGGIKGQPEIQ